MGDLDMGVIVAYILKSFKIYDLIMLLLSCMRKAY